MNNISKKMIDDEGREETVVAVSNDDLKVNITSGYTLANHKDKKENKFVKSFKKSLFGTDIGIKSKGFSSVAVLAVVIALAVLFTMYLIWRF